MAEFLDLVTPEKFFQILNENIHLGSKKCHTEVIPFIESLHRITAKNVKSPVDLPPFSRSTVDGFAVRASDTAGASATLPGYLTVVGEVLMGEPAQIDLKPGQAIKIATGGMLPIGADAVVMVEYTDFLDEMTIEFSRSVAQGENVVLKGDDIKNGELLLQKGHRIRPQDIGALAGLGITEIEVFRKPEVALLSTGDELISPYDSLKDGQIRDINSYSIGAYLEEMGCKVRNLGIVKDSFEKLKTTLEENKDCDLILISGGSSVGVKDMAVDVLNSLGEPGVIVHGVSVKPGKPTILAVVDDLPVIGLPGHPSSAWTIFHTLVRPMIQVLKGEQEIAHVSNDDERGIQQGMKAILNRNLNSDRGKEQYVPAKLIYNPDQGYIAEPILGKSSLITTLVQANGFIRIDTFQEGVDQGEDVEIRLF